MPQHRLHAAALSARREHLRTLDNSCRLSCVAVVEMLSDEQAVAREALAREEVGPELPVLELAVGRVTRIQG